jgi:hypothetical protein
LTACVEYASHIINEYVNAGYADRVAVKLSYVAFMDVEENEVAPKGKR